MSYLFTLILVYSFNFGYGVPVPLDPSIHATLLSSSLAALAQRCENKLITVQINSTEKQCSVPAPPYKENQLQCMVFYDINKQLCEAISHNRLAINDAIIAKINDPIKIEDLCQIAKDWTVLNITEYPLYKTTVEKVFKSPYKCVKVCSSDDVDSEDANYFCKYYKWGSELLAHQVSAGQPQVDNEAQSGVPSVVAQNPNENPVLPAHHIMPYPSIVTNVSSANTSTNTISKPVTSEVENTVKDENTALDKSINKEDILVLSASKPQLQSGVDNVDNAVESVADGDDLKTAEVEDEVAPAPVKQNPSLGAADRPPAVEISQLPHEEPEAKPKIDDTPKAPVDGSVDVQNNDKPKQILTNADPDDYPDSDDGKDGLSDTQGGDDGDGDMMNDPDVRPEPEIDLNKIKTPKRVETPMSSFNGDIDVFPNTIQDGFADDDDHFFPFFLTAVVMIVLLYVLYHNKSKVSKVVLGLIVEGRQSGRRRNSRGHAYRRLDTLEQAMSTNSTAPPSKIIY